MLACGHPRECLVEDEYGEDDPCCGWCEQVEAFRRHIDTLYLCLEDKAVIVPAGGTVVVNEPIGLLEVRSGTVHIEQPGQRSPRTLDVAVGS